jgi:membrane-bound lytic murein transglycosylase A
VADRGGALPGKTPVSFADLAGWDGREAQALVDGVLRHAAPGVLGRAAQAPWIGAVAARWAAEGGDADAFVARNFRPFRIEAPGFLTGYYEPVIEASRERTARFTVPLYRRPGNLVRVPPDPNLPGDGTWGRLEADGRVVPHPDRAAIAAGALAGQGLELAFVADPVDAFFAQVQGSARLRLTDGSEIRIGYNGKSGHPYTAVGRVLIDRGVLPEGGATMQTIRAALAADPTLVAPVLSANRSYVFFREREVAPDRGPIAAGGVALTPWRSLAVDRAHILMGTPVHIETMLPRRGEHHGVTIAEDTGSAIVGPARGDLFTGSGDEAGEIAGEMKAAAVLTLILPVGVAP